MKYLLKFLGEVKLMNTTFSRIGYHLLSKSFPLKIGGEKNYFVVTSQYELLMLTRSKKLTDDCLHKLKKLGLITLIENPTIVSTVVNNYSGKERYLSPKVYCVTPLIMLQRFLELLSSASRTKKESQIKFSIFERFMKSVEKAGTFPALFSAINSHKPIYEKENISSIKSFVRLAAGYYKAYKHLITEDQKTLKIVAI